MLLSLLLAPLLIGMPAPAAADRAAYIVQAGGAERKSLVERVGGRVTHELG